MWIIEKFRFKYRVEGWRDCEEMVLKRLKRHYPDKWEIMYQELIQ